MADEDGDLLRKLYTLTPTELVEEVRRMHEPPTGHLLRYLNGFTLAVLRCVDETPLPDGWVAGVSASSDVLLSHPESGHWVGVQPKGLHSKGSPSWTCWRGSLVASAPLDGAKFPTMAAAVEASVVALSDLSSSDTPLSDRKAPLVPDSALSGHDLSAAPDTPPKSPLGPDWSGER